MKSRAGPSGGGGIGMKCRNMFEPNTTKISPSRLRAITVAIFISILFFAVTFVLFRVKNPKSRGFQYDFAAPMTVLTQFVSAPDFRQGEDGFNHRLYLASVDQSCDFSQVG